jgi:riboflavin kinase/FMN adenylyltransferase
MNIGFNPTVAGENLSIEIHYFNFNSDLYDQEIAVSIINIYTPWTKFKSLTYWKYNWKR